MDNSPCSHGDIFDLDFTGCPKAISKSGETPKIYLLRVLLCNREKTIKKIEHLPLESVSKMINLMLSTYLHNLEARWLQRIFTSPSQSNCI